MFYVILAVPVVLLAMLGFAKLWARRSDPGKMKRMTCTRCHRVFGFPRAQAGRDGACPHCGQIAIFRA